MRVAIIALTASLATLKADLRDASLDYGALKEAIGTKDDALIKAAFAKMDSAIIKLNEDMGPIDTDMHPDAPKSPPNVHTALTHLANRAADTASPAIGHGADAPQAGSAAASAQTAAFATGEHGDEKKAVDPA